MECLSFITVRSEGLRDEASYFLYCEPWFVVFTTSAILISQRENLFLYSLKCINFHKHAVKQNIGVIMMQ